MALIDYTTYNEVRAALGVSTTEIPDSTLALAMYGFVADYALDEVNSALPALYELIKAEATPTYNQVKFLNLANLYVTYTVAVALLTGMPMFSVKQLTDGKAEFERQTDALELMIANVRGMHLSLRNRMMEIAGILDPTIVEAVEASPVLLLVSVLAVDPVTGA